MTWKTLNAWAGHVTFGLPAALTVPALASTITRFGSGAMATALPLAAIVALPFAAWLHHTRHPARTRRGLTVWALFALATMTMFLASPVFFWAVPVLAVLASEGTRMVVMRHRTHSDRPPHPTPAAATIVTLPRG